MNFDVNQLEHFPTQPGVYLMKNSSGQVIYVGKAKQLKTRVKQYFLSQGDSRPMIPLLIEQTTHIDTIIVSSEKEALLLENTLIKKHQPKFNAVLKDDKTFVSLMINNEHPWPMVRLMRYKGSPKGKGLYFGPYTSGYAAKKTYELLTRLFPLRQCSDEELKRRDKPCILYAIKRCLAPCVNKCTKEEYRGFVDRTIQFLKGEDREILKKLYAEMKQASDQLDFERAASLLETIRHLEHVLESQTVVAKIQGRNTDALGLFRQGSEVMLVQLLFREGKLVGSESYNFNQTAEEDAAIFSSFILQHYHMPESIPEEILIPFPLSDAPLLADILSEKKEKALSITYPQKGEKKEVLEMAMENAKALFYKEKDQARLKENTLFDLQSILKLNRYPRVIACFDTAHIAGSDPVASMVTFKEGSRDAKRARLFFIKTAEKSDDYGALKEVLTRYLTRAKQEDNLPDLIIVDGGKGQLNSADAVFKELDIASVDLIAITKEKGRHDKGMTAERIFLQGHADPIHLNTRSHLLFFLQNIRDEAHRKALSFHKTRRTKRHLVSRLDGIPGVGPIKKKRLLKKFGSVEKIKQASREELKQVKGISDKEIDGLMQGFNFNARDT